MNALLLRTLPIVLAVFAGLPSALCDDSLPGVVFVADDIFGPKFE